MFAPLGEYPLSHTNQHRDRMEFPLSQTTLPFATGDNGVQVGTEDDNEFVKLMLNSLVI